MAQERNKMKNEGLKRKFLTSYSTGKNQNGNYGQKKKLSRHLTKQERNKMNKNC